MIPLVAQAFVAQPKWIFFVFQSWQLSLFSEDPKRLDAFSVRKATTSQDSSKVRFSRHLDLFASRFPRDFAWKSPHESSTVTQIPVKFSKFAGKNQNQLPVFSFGNATTHKQKQGASAHNACATNRRHVVKNASKSQGLSLKNSLFRLLPKKRFSASQVSDFKSTHHLVPPISRTGICCAAKMDFSRVLVLEIEPFFRRFQALRRLLST